MKKRQIALLGFALLAGSLLLTGCTGGSASGEKESMVSSAASSAAEIEEEEMDLSDDIAAPEEDDTVDQGREGRPTDSWNADAPLEDEAESFALAEDADDEAAARAE